MPSLNLLKAIAREGVLTARAGMYPLARLRPMPTAGPLGSHTPVVLVHGFLGHRDMLRPIARRLYSEGWDTVERVGYRSTTARLEDVVDAIREVAVPLAKKHGGKVDIIGHSLGALASRAWIKALGGDDYVRRFISLGGPHAGTTWYFVSPPWLHDALRPDGPWAKLLNEGTEPVPTTVIRARYDHQVFPPARAAIDGVHEVVIGGYGHNGMLWAPEAHDAIVHALDAPGNTP
ncbi:MAG: alpha/beta fold hydrolase [Proteobacteria bacterium]|nr:alpha/beta fold hydrolase [Pseudomonadota bacterium]